MSRAWDRLGPAVRGPQQGERPHGPGQERQQQGQADGDRPRLGELADV
ncbi:hypothetical protein RB200_06475 [Streptomyces sp. PmtG]